MRYVDDLGSVKPDEIEHLYIKGKTIQHIVCCPEAELFNRLVVIYNDGSSYRYSKDGRSCMSSDFYFIYKPKKVKYLKSIKQLLEEFPEAEFDVGGTLFCNLWGDSITGSMLSSFGNRYESRVKDRFYLMEWVEEREED